MKKAAILLGFIGAILLMSRLFFQHETGEEVSEQAHEQVEQSETSNARPTTTAQPSSQSAQAGEIDESQIEARAPEFKKGKSVVKFEAGEVGYSPEGGGVGVAGISLGPDGKALLWDRYEEAYYRIDETGAKELVYKLGPDDEYMKGGTFGPNGEFVGLVGNTELTLVRQLHNGVFERIEIPGEAEYLNALRVEAQGDHVYLYGVDKTIEVGPDGSTREFYGAPLEESKSLDIVLNDNRQAVVTVRGPDGAPIETNVQTQVYGAVQGLYPEGQKVVAVFESDPYLNDFNRENPHYTVQLMDSNGTVTGSFQFPHGKGIAVDQPISIRDGRLYYTVQREGGELEVYEYSLE